MPDVFDYLRWRGDVPFYVSPLNDADSYILAKVGTPDYAGIVPENAAYVTLDTAIRSYLKNGGAEKLGALTSPYVIPVLKLLPETKRFGGLMLSGFRRLVSGENTEQFSALTLRLADGRHIVTFRGTDDTLIGWKENFLMSVQNAVPAQTDAAAYLQWAAEVYPGELILDGHSKGGNLAVYAAAYAEESLQKRISAVYNHDGPGFLPEFYQSPGYQGIRKRIRTILPYNSLVGTMLMQEKKCIVVQTEASGMAAHDGFRWEMQADGFAAAPGLSPASLAFDRALDEVMSGTDREKRLLFVEQFFGALSSAGAETVTDLTEQKFRQALSLLRNLRGEPEVQKMAASVLECMIKDYVTEKGKTLRIPQKLRKSIKKEK